MTRRGQLAAMLGRELRNSLNNTWLNYALPIDQLRKSVETICQGKTVAQAEKGPDKKPDHPMDLARLGIVLVPDMLERTPAYVDEVRAGSPAAQVGIRPDDLILLVGDRLAQSCKALRSELEFIDRDDRVHLTVLRGQELIDVVLEPPEEESPKP